MTDSSIIHQHMYLGRGRLHLRCLSVGRCNLPCQERPLQFTLSLSIVIARFVPPMSSLAPNPTRHQRARRMSLSVGHARIMHSPFQHVWKSYILKTVLMASCHRCRACATTMNQDYLAAPSVRTAHAERRAKQTAFREFGFLELRAGFCAK